MRWLLTAINSRLAEATYIIKNPLQKTPTLRASTVFISLCGVLLLPAVAHAQDGAAGTGSGIENKNKIDNKAENNSDTSHAIVTIAAKRVAVAQKLDKTVYDAALMPRGTSGTAEEVLQSTPGLSVSNDGRIAVKGNSQVTVLIDGKPTAMLAGSPQDRAVALQTMSGADIASIEVMTNPSAAYNANGGAVVNIVMKRVRKPGAHAQLQASAGDHGAWNVGSKGDFTRDGVSMHGTLGLRHDGTLKIRQSQLDWNNPQSGQSARTQQTSEVFIHRVIDSAALGLDAALSESDSLSLSADHHARRSRPLFDVRNVLGDGREQTIYHRISHGPNEQSDHSVSLSYSHHDQGTALKALLQQSATTALIDKSYSDVYMAPARATLYSRGATRSARRLQQATLDWSTKSTAGQWGAGVDVQDKVDHIDNYQARVDPSTAAETPDLASTNVYAVSTRMAAVYLTGQLRRGQWEALLGGRAEAIALQPGPAPSSAQSSHWHALNPSLHLLYALSGITDLTLTYRSSMQMPDPRDLDPATTYIDAQNLSRGNPALRPQRLRTWELGSSTQSAQLNRSLGAFYRISSDTVTDARSFDDHVLITSKQNGGHASSMGVIGAIEWTPDAYKRVAIDAGIYRVSLDTPDLDRLVRQSAMAAYINMNATRSVGRDSWSIDAHAQSATITPLGRIGPTSSVNLGWKRELSRTLSLTLNANDIFDGSRRSYRTESSTFRLAGTDHFVARRLYIGLVKTLN